MGMLTESEIAARLIGRQVRILTYAGTARKLSSLMCEVCGHQWEGNLDNIFAGRGCPKCAVDRRRLSLSVAIERLDGRGIEILQYNKNVRSHSTFRCLVDGCGFEWSADFGSVDPVKGAGSGCPMCAARRQPLSMEDATLMLRGRDISIVTYGGSLAARTICACDVPGCGYVWDTSIKHIHYAGFGCPRCAGVDPLLEDEARDFLATKNIGLDAYSGKMATKSGLRCLVPGCGHEWDNSVTSIKIGQGCPKCAGVLSPTLQEVSDALIPMSITVLRYDGTSSSVGVFKCLKPGCGHEWPTVVGKVYRGETGCPKCAEYGFNPGKPAIFYAYQIWRGCAEYIGFGISNRSRRITYDHPKSFKKAGATAELLFSYKTSGELALSLERTIKQNFPIVDTGIPGFRTEAFEYDEELLGLIKLGAEHAHSLYLCSQNPTK